MQGNASNFGFKEWAVICEALGSGRQSIIIRKGGIAEGREGFRFQHERFFLFPTFFHEQIAKTILPSDTLLPSKQPDIVQIRYLAKAEWSTLVQDLDTVKRLAPMHVWSEPTVEERFNYGEPQGVNVALVRVFELSAPWNFPDGPQFGGCRSWVELPALNENVSIKPVLEDAAHEARAAELRNICRMR